MAKFYVVSLGCSKNLVDSEFMIGDLLKQGWKTSESIENADLVIINTCGFIQPAVEEAIEEILTCSNQINSDAKLVVTGCMVQRYKAKLLEVLPEVDLFLGTEVINDFGLYLNKINNENDKIFLPGRTLPSSDSKRIKSTPFYRSWLKITEGCDNRCSYCMIPSIRGPLRSRKIVDLISEARELNNSGVLELGLIAQDLTSYGRDYGGNEELEKLLELLLSDTDIPWIRLLYLYPGTINDRLIKLMSENERITPYLDIPFQHVSSSVLKKMNRRYTKKDLFNLIDRLRKSIPDISLRTTFLLGFPGETLDDLKQVEEFLKVVEFDHVGVFPYSNEEGCPSEHFNDQLEEEEKKARVEHILSVQQKISENKLKRFVGQKLDVLIEGVSRETELLLEGRTKYQAPEIDGCVYINDGYAEEGTITRVEITDSQIYDLVGRII